MNIEDLDKIDIPEEFNSFVEDSLKKAYKIKDAKYKRSKLRKNIVTSSVASLCIFFTIGIFTPVIAKSLPVFTNIRNTLGLKNEYVDYAKDINLTQESNGVKVTLDQIVCDNKNLYISYIIESDTFFKDKSIKNISMDNLIRTDFSQYYNLEGSSAEEISNMIANFPVDYKPIESNSSIDGYLLNDTTFIGIASYDLTNFAVPENFKVKLNIDKLWYYPSNSNNFENESTEGTWNFEFTVNTSDTKINNKLININETKNNFTIKNVSISPFSIDIESIQPTEFLRNIGNMFVYDDKGRSLDFKVGHYENYSDDNPTNIFIQKNSPLIDDSEYITIKFEGTSTEFKIPLH